jgi:hypothetical protein
MGRPVTRRGGPLHRGARIDLVVSTTKVAAGVEFGYRATLAGRPYGQASSTGPARTNLATRTGRGQPPERLLLLFEAVELPAGIQRLRLELMLRPQSPTRRAPTLELG